MDKILKIEDMIPIITEVVNSGSEFRMVTAGISMLPLLRDRKDTVVLVKAEKPLKKYDIPLYRRNDGQFVLHRIVAVKNGEYTMCGDHQIDVEHGITDNNIYAVVKAVERNGKYISCNDSGYKLYSFLRVHTRVLRKISYKVYYKLKRVKSKK